MTVKRNLSPPVEAQEASPPLSSKPQSRRPKISLARLLYAFVLISAIGGLFVSRFIFQTETKPFLEHRMTFASAVIEDQFQRLREDVEKELELFFGKALVETRSGGGAGGTSSVFVNKISFKKHFHHHLRKN